MSENKKPVFAVCILNTAGISCCGFREAYQYRSGEIFPHEDHGREMVKDSYFGPGYLEQNHSVGRSDVSLQEAAKQCTQKWLNEVKTFLSVREKSYKISGEAMRTFNFVKRTEGDDFYSKELREEVAKIDCQKQIMTYKNANTGNIIETHILIIDKDTSYVG